MFAHHEEEEEVYLLTLTEIADAQRKDRELKAYFKINAIMPQETWVSNLLRTPKCYAKMEK